MMQYHFVLLFLVYVGVHSRRWDTPTYLDVKLECKAQVRIFKPMARVVKRNEAPGVYPCDAMVIAVGTAMTSQQYNKLAARLVTPSKSPLSKGQTRPPPLSVVILDMDPFNMNKHQPVDYAEAVIELKARLITLLNDSPDTGALCASIDHWIVGGHSGGGQAAHQAVADNPDMADAIFSLDPFEIKEKSPTIPANIPAMYWGFDKTTCFVDIEKGGKAAYAKSLSPYRSFFRVNTDQGKRPWILHAEYYHCAFTDEGCMVVCENYKAATPPNFLDDVAKSGHVLVQMAFYTSPSGFTKSAIAAAVALHGAETPMELFFGNDVINGTVTNHTRA